MSPLYFFFLTIFNWQCIFALINKAQLPFQDEQAAKAFAIDFCETLVGFMSSEDEIGGNDDAFVAYWGPSGHFFNDDSMLFLDGRPVRQYAQIKTRLGLMRHVMDTDPAYLCFDDINEGYNNNKYNIKYPSYKVQVDTNEKLGFKKIHAMGKSQRHVKITITFDSNSGCVKQAKVRSNGNFVGIIIDWTATVATTAVDIGAYLGLIEDEIEGTNKNIEMISNVFVAILIFVVLLMAIIIGLCVNLMLKRNQNQKYSTVSMKSDTDL